MSNISDIHDTLMQLYFFSYRWRPQRKAISNGHSLDVRRKKIETRVLLNEETYWTN